MSGLDRQDHIDMIFRALADPTRRAVVERLTDGPLTVSALSEPLDMTLTAVTQHLRILEQSGLLRSEKTGRVRTCALVPESLMLLERWVADRRAIQQFGFDTFDWLPPGR